MNDYLREIGGADFTAKDFRTWAGTALAAQALREFLDFDSKAAAKRNITAAIERVAERLGNTQAICRKSYVHPAIIRRVHGPLAREDANRCASNPIRARDLQLIGPNRRSPDGQECAT